MATPASAKRDEAVAARGWPAMLQRRRQDGPVPGRQSLQCKDQSGRRWQKPRRGGLPITMENF